MKKRLKAIVTIATLAFSLSIIGFSVYAANNHTLGMQNFIVFDIEDNISFDIEAKTSIGNSVGVTYDGIPNTAKVLQANAGMGGTSLSSTSSDFSNGVWTPYAKSTPADLNMSNNIVYWMFKVTNLGGNPIQVRVTDTNDSTLFRPTNACRVYKKFGTSSSQELTNTSSGEIAQNGVCYMLIVLEVTDKTGNIDDKAFNFKVHVEKANASYLKTNWYSSISSGFETVEFLGGDGEAYTGAGTATYTFGATDKNGTTALSTETETVKQITGYVNGKTLYIHSPARIYAPVDCSSLFAANSTTLSTVKSLNLSNFDTCNTANMQRMFNYSAVSNLNLSQFDTANATSMAGMFQNVASSTLNVSNFDTSNVLTMQNMFYKSQFLLELNVSGWDTSKVQNMRNMFCGTDTIVMKLVNLDVSRWDVSSVTTFHNMFGSCIDLVNLDVSNWNTSSATTMKGVFQACYSLTELDVSNWNTSKVTDMSYMFYGVAASTLPVENWDVSKVTNMDHIFNDTSLTRLDLSRWNTESVENMAMMFNNCKNLQYLDISNFNTSKVTTMEEMFDGCHSLTELDLSHFNTSNVTIMEEMFGFETGIPLGLRRLVLGNWDTSKVTDMAGMFAGLSNLIELDISSFTISSSCDLDYENDAGGNVPMLKIGNSTYPPQLTKLITPKSVGKAIDISTLGLKLNGTAQSTIAVGTSKLTLTK